MAAHLLRQGRRGKAGQLLGRDVLADRSGRRGLCQQVGEEDRQVLVCVDHVAALVQIRCKLLPVVIMDHERIRHEDRCEALGITDRPVRCAGENLR